MSGRKIRFGICGLCMGAIGHDGHPPTPTPRGWIKGWKVAVEPGRAVLRSAGLHALHLGKERGYLEQSDHPARRRKAFDTGAGATVVGIVVVKP